MPTSFISVQCFQCSTMQVKQQKKSSNKWSCVVCNEKQSVRNVFAQSFMAKDVRKFVQNFNMSRQLSDQKQLYNHDSQQIIVDSPTNEQQKRKKNDWTEYIDDDQEEYCRKFEKERSSPPGDDGFEPLCVTEMPEVIFVKPKVKDYSCAENLLKPSFPKRRNGKRHQDVHCLGKNDLDRDLNIDCTKRDEDDSHQALKWNNFMAQIRGNCSSAKGEIDSNGENNFMTQIRGNCSSAMDENYSNGKHLKIAGKKVSKWSSFITEEDVDGVDNVVERSLENRERRDDHVLEMSINDERVEEDVHPDFL